MNKHLLIHDRLDLGPNGVPMDVPSLTTFLGLDQAPLTFEIGLVGNPIRLYADNPDDLDMAAANGLSRWIEEIRSAARPWEVLAMEGAITPPADLGRPLTFAARVATALDLSTLRAAAFLVRQPLPAGIANQLTRDDRVVASIMRRPYCAAGPDLMAHIELEDFSAESRFTGVELAELNRHLQVREKQFVECILSEHRWFQSSGILRLDLAIGILPDTAYA